MSITEFAAAFMEAGASIITNSHPWPEFLDPLALTLPSSFSDATTRVSQNLTRFLSNYFLVFAFIIFLSLIHHPFSMVAYLLLFISWLFLYFAPHDPTRVCGFRLADSILVIFLGLATGFALTFTGVFLNVLISLATGALLVLLHAALRSTDDLLGDLLDPFIDVLLESPRGDYSGI